MTKEERWKLHGLITALKNGSLSKEDEAELTLLSCALIADRPIPKDRYASAFDN